MTAAGPSDYTSQIVDLVREFVRRDVEPVASRYDNDDVYPAELADRMAELGLFGITIPEEHGGLGLDHTTFATTVPYHCQKTLPASHPVVQ